MRVLIILAHGSRSQTANQEVQTLVELQRNSDEGQFERYEAAFLEIATPSFTTVLEEILTENPQEMVVLPYFLTRGVHVDKDIPAVIEQFKAHYTNCQFTVLPHIGASQNMQQLIQQVII